MGNNEFNVILFEWRYTQSPYKYTLGLEYITAYLRKEGINAKNFVFEAEMIQDAVEEVLACNPSVIGIHFYREAETSIFSFARKIKQVRKDITIVVGGHTATLFSAHILQKEPCIDIVSYGEGELTFVDMCKRIQNKESLRECKGIFYRKDDCIMRNPERELIENLDELPYPSLDIVIEKNKTTKAVFAAISTSRGCMGNCKFCIATRIYDNVAKKAWRGRSPESIIGEILRLKETFSDKRISYRIVDGSIEDPDPINKERLTRLVELYEKNNIRIPFEVLTRAESWSEKDIPLIKRLRNIGLYAAAIGYEASTAESLKVFNKRANLENNYLSYKLFTENGIDVFGFLIMFHPYTTFEELKKNANFLLEVDMAYQPQCWWSELYLWPDSKILPDIVRDGLLLGFEKKGYQLQYGFVDGYVETAYRYLGDISALESVQAYWETIEKVKVECLLYNVWKLDYEDLLVVEEEMKEYEQKYNQCRKGVGIAQYNIFIKMLNYIEMERFDEIKVDLIKEWDNIMIKNQKELQQLWLTYRLKLGRKKVLLF